MNAQTRNPGGRTGRLLATSLAGALLCGVAGLLTAHPAAADATVLRTVNFSATGAPQQWVVPPDVTSATFDISGAAGGQGDGQGDPGQYGLGGNVIATMPVVPGTTYTIVVGTRGQFGVSGGAGGFNGGGAGGKGNGQANGGGGGGATDVRFGTASDPRVLVAGGGGGSSGSGSSSATGQTNAPGSPGGAGGGNFTAGAGGNGSNGGGGAGSATSGGVGGPLLAGCCNPGAPGVAGGGGTGGDGFPAGGGGGGGGWFGGGGGAGSVDTYAAGGGGGGGSGYADSSATVLTVQPGVQTGDGRATIQFRSAFDVGTGGPTSTAPTISGAVNGSVVLGASYSHRYVVTGVPTPTLTATGLPDGITLAQDGTLSGTPTAAGQYPFTITASNGTAPDAVVEDQLTVVDLSPIQNGPTITGTPPSGEFLLDYDFTYTLGGPGTVTARLDSGRLPEGLELTGDGRISGRPTEAGSFTFTVVADNGSGVLPAVTSTIVVTRAPAVIGTPPPAVVGVPYSFTFTTTGSPTPVFTVRSGTLPAGLVWAGDGVISGTPTAAGPGSPVTVAAENGTGQAALLTFTIPVSAPSPAISGTPPTAGVGEPYSFTFTTTGNPTVTKSAGSLPPGISLSTSGRLAGTPTKAGSYTFTVRAVAGTAAPVTQDVTLVVRPVPTVSVSCIVVTEGNSGTRPLTVTVTLSRASSVPVSVRWTTANGTAVSGSDYVAASGTVTFAPGQTSRTVTVQVRGDRTRERDEYFLVRLASPSHAAIDRGTAVAAIRNDD